MDYGDAYLQYQTERSGIRRLVRRAYLRSATKLLRGASLDIGCGAGDLLSMLPAGSVGLELNKEAVRYGNERGLDVRYYDGDEDGWALGAIKSDDQFQSIVISHVLEHLAEPEIVLGRILTWAAKRNVSRVLVVVPGPVGFRADPTHVVYIDQEMLAKSEVVSGTTFRLSEASYFPLNLSAAGEYFRHQELRALFTT